MSRGSVISYPSKMLSRQGIWIWQTKATVVVDRKGRKEMVMGTGLENAKPQRMGVTTNMRFCGFQSKQRLIFHCPPLTNFDAPEGVVRLANDHSRASAIFSPSQFVADGG